MGAISVLVSGCGFRGALTTTPDFLRGESGDTQRGYEKGALLSPRLGSALGCLIRPADRCKGRQLTTEFADGGESSIQLPSYEDVQKELKKVRQQEGVSVRRISTYGQSLQQLRISQDEFRRSGSEPGTLLMATIDALRCAVRSFGEESVHFTVLDTTLNFRGVHATLTDRQQKVMHALHVYSKTTYESYEKNSYEMFAYRIVQQANSFCGQTESSAAAIAKLPFDQRVACIQVLLDVRLSMLPVNQNVLAEEVLRALPGLSSVPQLDGMNPLQKIDRAVIVLIRQSRLYSDVRQANTAIPEAAFHILEEIARHYHRRQFALPGNDMLAMQFDRALAAQLGDDERKDPSRLVNFGEMSQLKRQNLKRFKSGGRFSRGAKPTKRFEQARLSGVRLLATLLVETDQSNAWKELFEQPRSSKPQPPPSKPTDAKNPDRPKKIWKSRWG